MDSPKIAEYGALSQSNTSLTTHEEQSPNHIAEELKSLGEDVKRTSGVSGHDQQFDAEIEEEDIYMLAENFDTVTGLVEKLNLTPANCGDVKRATNTEGTQAGVAKALKLWRKMDPSKATYKSLLEIAESLGRRDTAALIREFIYPSETSSLTSSGSIVQAQDVPVPSFFASQLPGLHSAANATGQRTEKAVEIVERKYRTLQLGTRHDAAHHLVCETSSLTINNSTAQTHALPIRSSSVGSRLPQIHSESGDLEGELLALERSYVTGDGLNPATVGELKTVVFHAMTKQKIEYKGSLNLEAELKHIKSKDRVQCDGVTQRNGLYKFIYQPVKRGKHELHLTINRSPVQGSPWAIDVTPGAQSLNKPVKIIPGLDRPRNTTVNREQQIVAVHNDGTCVSILTPQGVEIQSFGTKGSKIGQLHNAFGVAVDTDDNIYVVDCDNHRVQKFSPEGMFKATVGEYGHHCHQFHSPVGICYNHRDNKLYVADQCNHRIHVLTTELALMRSFGKKGKKDGQFNLPFNVAFDSDNNLYVTDHFNDRVQVLTTDGQFLRAFSVKSNGEKLIRPWAITIDSSNTVYVSENGPHCVSVFTSQGDYITTFGGKGRDMGRFEMIWGLSVVHDDTIIASDLGNGRLQFY